MRGIGAGRRVTRGAWLRRMLKRFLNIVCILQRIFLGRKFPGRDFWIRILFVAERDGVDLIIEQWRRERPELDPSPIGVIGRISRLARELEQRLELVYRERGLEPGWYDVLATLRRAGPPYRLRPTEFTSALMLTSSGTTKRLDRLEQAGLIERAPDPQDRRGTLITLTTAGRELVDGTTEAHLENERRLLGALSEADRRRLADLLRKLRLGLPPPENGATG